jgi:DHA1 family multidrug resistance protein-like MFS transporter
MFAALVLAANTIARSAAGAAAPLYTRYMFNALGVGGGGSLIGRVACLLAPIPFVFYKYGEPIRKRSKFAPTLDKEDEGVRQQISREQRAETESESDVSGVDFEA